jgi:hypothetical protein
LSLSPKRESVKMPDRCFVAGSLSEDFRYREITLRRCPSGAKRYTIESPCVERINRNAD